MIVVALDHAAQRDVVLAERRGVGRTPPVRHVGHDQYAQSIGPVQFARCFDLDMLPQAVQPNLARPEDLIAQHAVRWKRVVALRMVRLIERELEIDRRAVECDVAVRRTWQVHDADRPHAEIGLDAILS